jgi:hypothetical protein
LFKPPWTIGQFLDLRSAFGPSHSATGRLARLNDIAGVPSVWEANTVLGGVIVEPSNTVTR